MAAEASDCAQCHEDVVAAFGKALHGKEACSDCHGDAVKHLQEGGKGTIIGFPGADTPIANVKKCLECHKESAGSYFASSHGKASMDCTQCHKVHTSKAKHRGKGATKTCLSCHADVYSEFQLNERHRLQEGILGCTDCHNPHVPGTRERLGGFKQEACLKCHTDKGGPFIYEHSASRIEGCTACHEVHGSPNRHMLTFQSSPDLCFSCHTSTPYWHAYFGAERTNCTTCHSTIHGSNFDHLFLR